MNILVADKFDRTGLEAFSELGLQVKFEPDLKDEALESAISEFQPNILVVRSTKVNAAILEKGVSLSLIIRAGAGVNTIDVARASELGIFVANCPGKNAVAVAELTWAFITALDRRLVDCTNDLRNGTWNKQLYGKARGLKGRTLGLVGLGNIGREVLKRAKAFEMNVCAWSRSLTKSHAEELGICYCACAQDVARASDIVSVHVALTDDTRELCDSAFFSVMNEGAFFINTSRAEVVDEQALLSAIEQKSISAGLDVFCSEPSAGAAEEWKSDLSAHPSVIGTHHIGASTVQAQSAIAAEAIRVVKNFVCRGTIYNCVNLDPAPSAAAVMSVRHENRVGVLAAVLGAVQEQDINVLDMQNEIFLGGKAAIAKMSLSAAPDTKKISSLSSAIYSCTVKTI